jgi:hypothetical protein
MLEFLHDLGEIAAAGGDIRQRLFASHPIWYPRSARETKRQPLGNPTVMRRLQRSGWR